MSSVCIGWRCAGRTSKGGIIATCPGYGSGERPLLCPICGKMTTIGTYETNHTAHLPQLEKSKGYKAHLDGPPQKIKPLKLRSNHRRVSSPSTERSISHVSSTSV